MLPTDEYALDTHHGAARVYVVTGSTGIYVASFAGESEAHQFVADIMRSAVGRRVHGQLRVTGDILYGTGKQKN